MLPPADSVGTGIEWPHDAIVVALLGDDGCTVQYVDDNVIEDVDPDMIYDGRAEQGRSVLAVGTRVVVRIRNAPRACRDPASRRQLVRRKPNAEPAPVPEPVPAPEPEPVPGGDMDMERAVGDRSSGRRRYGRKRVKAPVGIAPVLEPILAPVAPVPEPAPGDVMDTEQGPLVTGTYLRSLLGEGSNLSWRAVHQFVLSHVSAMQRHRLLQRLPQPEVEYHDPSVAALMWQKALP